MRLVGTAPGPVVIADTPDNPGASGDSNTTGMLRVLAAHGAQGAALGLLCDPQAAAAHAAGRGATIHLALGGRSGTAGDAPLEADFTVEHLSDGKCVLAGPMQADPADLRWRRPAPGMRVRPGGPVFVQD